METPNFVGQDFLEQIIKEIKHEFKPKTSGKEKRLGFAIRHLSKELRNEKKKTGRNDPQRLATLLKMRNEAKKLQNARKFPTKKTKVDTFFFYSIY
jgi:hypothetical protein